MSTSPAPNAANLQPLLGYLTRAADLVEACPFTRLHWAQRASSRSNLYFRLKGWQLELPPLRERVRDLPLLVDALWANVEPKRKPSSDAVTALQRPPWRATCANWTTRCSALVHTGDAPVLDAACFDDLERAPTAPSKRSPFDTPAAVLELAMDAWNQGRLSELPQVSR